MHIIAAYLGAVNHTCSAGAQFFSPCRRRLRAILTFRPSIHLHGSGRASSQLDTIVAPLPAIGRSPQRPRRRLRQQLPLMAMGPGCGWSALPFLGQPAFGDREEYFEPPTDCRDTPPWHLVARRRPNRDAGPWRRSPGGELPSMLGEAHRLRIVLRHRTAPPPHHVTRDKGFWRRRRLEVRRSLFLWTVQHPHHDSRGGGHLRCDGAGAGDQPGFLRLLRALGSSDSLLYTSPFSAQSPWQQVSLPWVAGSVGNEWPDCDQRTAGASRA